MSKKQKDRIKPIFSDISETYMEEHYSFTRIVLVFKEVVYCEKPPNPISLDIDTLLEKIPRKELLKALDRIGIN